MLTSQESRDANKCCGCWGLRTGSGITCVYTLAVSVVLILVDAVRMYYVLMAEDRNQNYILSGWRAQSLVCIIWYLMWIWFALLLSNGVNKGRRVYIITWLVWTIVICLLMLANLIYHIVTLSQSGIVDQYPILQLEIIAIFQIVLYFTTVGINIYAIICMAWIIKEIDDKTHVESADDSFRGIQPVNKYEHLRHSGYPRQEGHDEDSARQPILNSGSYQRI